MISPLTGDDRAVLVRRIAASELIDRWRRGFQIDVSDEIAGIDEILLFRCLATNLLFFEPANAAGSDQLYERLAAFPWYYMPHKWEHDAALSTLRPGMRVLEAGCGQGDFLQRLKSMGFGDVVGAELNMNAARRAREGGLDVRSSTFEEFADDANGGFDAICAFQVLEHIARPLPFLQGAAKLLNPGGELILSTPNAESFLQYDRWHLLDMPPHHMARWSATTFQKVAETLSLTVRECRREPLAAYHATGYATTHLARWIPWRKGARMLGKAGGTILRSLPVLRRRLQGHTLFVRLQKRGENAAGIG